MRGVSCCTDMVQPYSERFLFKLFFFAVVLLLRFTRSLSFFNDEKKRHERSDRAENIRRATNDTCKLSANLNVKIGEVIYKSCI